jgi:hypothetical protein
MAQDPNDDRADSVDLRAASRREESNARTIPATGSRAGQDVVHSSDADFCGRFSMPAAGRGMIRRCEERFAMGHGSNDRRRSVGGY